MVLDFIVGIISSIAASIILGALSNKAFGKSKDILTSIYTIYIGFSAFVFSLLMMFLMSENIQAAFMKWSGTSIFTLIRYISVLFVVLFLNITIVTIIFIIVRQMELTGKQSEGIKKKY